VKRASCSSSSASWASSSLAFVAALALGASCEPGRPGPAEDEEESNNESDDEREDEGGPCFFGDPDAAPEGELVWRTLDGRVEPLVDGQPLPLIRPPQGGKIVALGARLKNVGCALTITAGAFDDCKGVFLGVDGRPLHLAWNDATGWAEPATPASLDNYGNVALCFNNNSGRDTNDEEYRFDVRIDDTADPSRTLTLSGRAIPFCAEPPFADDCDCECDVDFSFDAACDAVRVDPDASAGTCLEGANANDAGR
jgi:hypothetical protein